MIITKSNGVGNQLCSTKIADTERMMDEIQQKLVASPTVCNDMI